MTRYLVTGAGGFLGSHLVQRLLASPAAHVTCVDSFRHNGDTDNVADAVGDRRDRVTVITHDLRAPLSARQVARVGAIDVILDVASRASVDESMSDPGDFILNNVALTVNTLELGRHFDCARYIHMSTDEIYGDNPEPCETTDHRPSSPYAASKAAQEDICYAYRRTYSSPITVITSANIFGERQSQLAFIPRVVSATLNDRLVTVHTHDDEPGWRRYNYVGDVADFMTRKLTHERLSDWPDRLQLAGRHVIDNETLVVDIGRILGRGVRYRLQDGGVTRPGYDNGYPHLDDANDDRFNDWQVTRPDQPSFSSRLEQTVRWYASHLDWLR